MMDISETFTGVCSEPYRGVRSCLHGIEAVMLWGGVGCGAVRCWAVLCTECVC